MPHFVPYSDRAAWQYDTVGTYEDAHLPFLSLTLCERILKFRLVTSLHALTFKHFDLEVNEAEPSLMPLCRRSYSLSYNELELHRVPRIKKDRRKRSELPSSTWLLMRQNIVSITDHQSIERLPSLKIETIERVCTMSSGSSKVECDSRALWHSVDTASRLRRRSKPPFGSNVPENEHTRRASDEASCDRRARTPNHSCMPV